MASHPNISGSVITVTFTTMRGEPAGIGDEVQDVTRPGVDGHEIRRRGKRGRLFRVRTAADFTTAANARAAILDYHKLRGDVVTLTDAHAVDWTEVLVSEVRTMLYRQGATIVGGRNVNAGGAGVVVQAVWDLRLMKEN